MEETTWKRVVALPTASRLANIVRWSFVVALVNPGGERQGESDIEGRAHGHFRTLTAVEIQGGAEMPGSPAHAVLERAVVAVAGAVQGDAAAAFVKAPGRQPARGLSRIESRYVAAVIFRDNDERDFAFRRRSRNQTYSR